jgi:long-chain acyl-CoA synthetase
VGGDATDAEAYAALATAPQPLSESAALDEEATAVILYTSGTTGRPKGAMLTHFNIVHSVMHYELCMGMRPGERSLLAVPASHVTGVVAIILSAIRCGGTIVMMREFKARACLELMARERITHSIMVPAMYNLCLMDPEFQRFDLGAFRIGGYGGAPMPQATITALTQKLPNLALVNAYGATETTSPTTIMPPGRTAERPDSVGRVVPCGDLRVMDAEGREVAPGEAGEIWIGGPMVVKGYWDNPQASVQAFVGGYWRSGDIGSIDAEGYVRVFDRTKDMVNRGGYKIYSVEVENILKLHPAVIECAVVPRPDPVLGEKTHAFVVSEDPSCSAKGLQDFCAQHLSDYKIPDFITLQAQPLPRNANGKVLKRELRESARASS